MKAHPVEPEDWSREWSRRAERPRLAVVIPCFRVQEKVLRVIAAIGPEVDAIYVVDDACSDRSGELVREECDDPRVKVLFHERNQGVGGAMITGYRQALTDGATVVVKIDGDGQMDPALIPRFLHPILSGEADYTKGNRFYNLQDVAQMPWLRVQGNVVWSFISKIATGYWDLFDPTNGYTAVHAQVLAMLPLDRIAKGYFFESDMLFRLNTIRAVIEDVPMKAKYGDEKSGLRVGKHALPFLFKSSLNLVKRLGYNYLLRGFNIASLYLLFGLPMLCFGVWQGLTQWERSIATGVPATSGTVMLAALPIILGVQLLLSFFAYDMQSAPSRVLHTRLPPLTRADES